VSGGAAWALYLLAEYLPVAATMRGLRQRPRVPWATGIALLVVGVPTLVQLTVAPSLLDVLERQRDAILAGEVWRLTTSLVVQDGGTAGAVGNLVALAVVGAVAEQVWDRRRWVAIALGSAVAGELWGLVVQPVGGGNSVAVFGLSASLAVVAVRQGDAVARGIAVVALVACGVLLVTGDLHGGAALAGGVLAIALGGPHVARREIL
jgi:membrane associated rhomboid family serine protease